MIDSMARRLVNTTIKNQRDTFTFELFDMSSDSVDLDYIVEFDQPGFEINWRGDEDDSPIIPSTMSWTMYLNETQRGAIMPVVFSENEFDLCVRVKKGNNVFWCGIVHAERASEVIGDGTIAVSLQASDGLGMLSNISWKQANGDRYSGQMKLRDALWGALGKLPHTSLIAGTGGAVLVEHALNRPLTQNGGELFSHSALDSNSYGVMDYMQLNPSTIYYSNEEEERTVRGQKWGAVKRFNPDELVDSNLVVKDIMASLGASICFAEGKWHVFDKTYNFMADENDTYRAHEWYVTASNELDTYAGIQSTEYSTNRYDKGALGYAGQTQYNSHPRYDFLRGIARKAVHAVRGVTQKHTRAGSDLLYANGIGYHDSKQRPVWETGQGFDKPLLRLTRFNRQAAANRDFVEYIGFFMDGDDLSYDGLFNTRNRDRQVDELSIPNGANEGGIRVHLSGNVRYTHKNIFGNQNTWGSLMIYKQRFEVYDGTNWYRLSRPVRTQRYDTGGLDTQVNIQGAGGGTYTPKYWDDAEWIIDTDPKYTYAWLDVPLGINNSIIEEGTVTKFLQTDFPNTDFYTPPLTKLASDSDNVLDKDNDRNTYVWRHDFVYETPQASGTIQSIKVSEPVLEEWHGEHGPNANRNSSGTALDIGTNVGTPAYRTRSTATTTDGVGNKPNSVEHFQLSGLEVMFGDGTNEFDQFSTAFPATPQGRQIMNLNGTRFGASFVNTGASTHGRYTSSDFVSPTTQEDNLKFQSPLGGDIEENLSALVCRNMLDVRGKVRQSVTGAAQLSYEDSSFEQTLYPFSRLITDQLDTTTRMIIPTDVSYTMTGGVQRVTGFFRTASAEANIGGTTEVENDTTRGPLPAKGNMEKPSGTDLSDFLHDEATTNTGTGGGGGGQFGDIFPIFIKRY